MLQCKLEAKNINMLVEIQYPEIGLPNPTLTENDGSPPFIYLVS